MTGEDRQVRLFQKHGVGILRVEGVVELRVMPMRWAPTAVFPEIGRGH
jgi:hypothetical protein